MYNNRHILFSRIHEYAWIKLFILAYFRGVRGKMPKKSWPDCLKNRQKVFMPKVTYLRKPLHTNVFKRKMPHRQQPKILMTYLSPCLYDSKDAKSTTNDAKRYYNMVHSFFLEKQSFLMYEDKFINLEPSVSSSLHKANIHSTGHCSQVPVRFF